MKQLQLMFAIVLPLVPMFHTKAYNLPFCILNEQKLVLETLLRNVSGNCFHSDLISALGSNTVLKSWVKDEVEARSKQVKNQTFGFSKLCEQIVKKAKKRRCQKLQLDKTLSLYEVLQNTSAVTLELNNQ